MPAFLPTYIYPLRCLKVPFRGTQKAQAKQGPGRYEYILPKKGTPYVHGSDSGVIYIYIIHVRHMCLETHMAKDDIERPWPLNPHIVSSP